MICRHPSGYTCICICVCVYIYMHYMHMTSLTGRDMYRYMMGNACGT
jgi:hypothetical protein